MVVKHDILFLRNNIKRPMKTKN